MRINASGEDANEMTLVPVISQRFRPGGLENNSESEAIARTSFYIRITLHSEVY